MNSTTKKNKLKKYNNKYTTLSNQMPKEDLSQKMPIYYRIQYLLWKYGKVQTKTNLLDTTNLEQMGHLSSNLPISGASVENLIYDPVPALEL